MSDVTTNEPETSSSQSNSDSSQTSESTNYESLRPHGVDHFHTHDGCIMFVERQHQ